MALVAATEGDWWLGRPLGRQWSPVESREPECLGRRGQGLRAAERWRRARWRVAAVGRAALPGAGDDVRPLQLQSWRRLWRKTTTTTTERTPTRMVVVVVVVLWWWWMETTMTTMTTIRRHAVKRKRRTA